MGSGANLSPVPLYFSSLSLLHTALHYLNAWNRLSRWRQCGTCYGLVARPFRAKIPRGVSEKKGLGTRLELSNFFRDMKQFLFVIKGASRTTAVFSLDWDTDDSNSGDSKAVGSLCFLRGCQSNSEKYKRRVNSAIFKMENLSVVNIFWTRVVEYTVLTESINNATLGTVYFHLHFHTSWALSVIFFFCIQQSHSKLNTQCALQ